MHKLKGGKVDTESAKLNKLQTNNLIKKAKQLTKHIKDLR